MERGERIDTLLATLDIEPESTPAPEEDQDGVE
jgi:hypothetical protein